ncbi:hypothetical protein NQ015_07780 [Corynebacterium sp. 153RC1]|uniref:hypothetical protein n=1 Tax=unclassified Corynebacterium TaxID=2624378 RepID=UPI00211BD67B|nr:MULTISPECIES: hypothetical protein [unclassified Corynebacterium]MCQ9352846.1 hypothetical protein [Corynebacterium sp. 209RC1]MCQ9355238.1 hypothetical protein [Corynebacterium sp. 1222RC1]MCQ9357425.1 hypothetical protein [Corynebacterium sp. 122RC1]MCQ9359647.1 hypothetical protein [Corynebacterium sp. 142RC1]MCQ9361661.1 hypothetical protein [Corynebacterium sp. 153RC1]
MSQADVYPINDTEAGRIAQAVAVGAYYALPDFIPNRALRAAVNAAIIAGAAGVVAYANAQDDNPDNDILSAELRPNFEGNAALTWGLIAGAAGLTALGLRIDAAVTRKATAVMRKAGIKLPNTLLGIVAAGGVYALSK